MPLLYYRGRSLVSIRPVPPGKIKGRGTSNKYATNSGVSHSNVHTIAGVIHTTKEVPESLGMLTELRQLPAILSSLDVFPYLQCGSELWLAQPL